MVQLPKKYFRNSFFWALFLFSSCSGNRSVEPKIELENTAALCDDDVDNDWDGRVDCNDADCAKLPMCCFSRSPSPSTESPADIRKESPSSGHSELSDAHVVSNQLLIINHRHTDVTKIPREAISRAKRNLHVAYQHTSHGSQLVSGLIALSEFPPFGDTYSLKKEGGGLDFHDGAMPTVSDLSTGDFEDKNGDTPWVVATRDLLKSTEGKKINIVLWSWCSINGHDAQRYVSNMEKLISEFPNVVFPFMTGHAEGMGHNMEKNGIHFNNELIRNHVRKKGRVLFDFADIEAYDPDGNYFWDKRHK